MTHRKHHDHRIPTRRLLFLVPALDVGGAERHLSRVLRRLDRERFHCQVVCIKADGALASTLRDVGVEVITLTPSQQRPHRVVGALVSAMRAFRPDLVITQGFNADILGALCAPLAGVRRRVTWKHNAGYLRRKARDRVLTPWAARTAHAVLGVAYGQVEFLVNGLGVRGSKVRIVQNGVDLSEFPKREPGRRPETAAADDLGIRPDDVVVGIVAVLRPEKRHDVFLRAGKLLVDAEPRVRLLIIGDGPERDRLEDLAADLGISPRVIFAGQRGDVADMLAMMDVTVLCSRSECGPLVILEAMATGRPVVATAVGGIPEMVDHGQTGLLVPPDDPQGLAAAVRRLTTDPSLRYRMGDAGRRRVEDRFTLGRCIEETAAVFDELSRPPRR